MLYRLHAVDLPRETVRRIIRRNQRVIAELQHEQRRHGRFDVEHLERMGLLAARG